MKLIVLCGGKGTRLGGLTKDIPKPLVKIGNERIIDIALKPHEELEYIFSAGYKGLTMSHFVCMNYPGSECYIENETLGTGGAIKEIAETIEDDYFAVINGDTYFDIDIKNLRKTLSRSLKNKLICSVLGVNALTQERTYAGVYLIHKDFLQYIHSTPFHLEDAIRKCREDKKATFYVTNKEFYDLGTTDGIDLYKKVFS